MIQHRRTVHIAPGKQDAAIIHAHEWANLWGKVDKHPFRVQIVTSGSLGRLVLSSNHESLAAFETVWKKVTALPDNASLVELQRKEGRSDVDLFVPGTAHDEFLRDA